MDEHRQELAAWAKAVNGVIEAAESFGSCTRDEILDLANVCHEQDSMLQPGKVFRARVGAVRPCPSGVDIGLDSGGGEKDFSTWITVRSDAGLPKPKVGDVVLVQPPMVTSVLPGEAVGLDKPPGKV